MKKRIYFTDEEYKVVWDDARKRGILYNGMTGNLLQDHYGFVVYHEMGVGHFHQGELVQSEEQK
jgi:hypothetical protein